MQDGPLAGRSGGRGGNGAAVRRVKRWVEEIWGIQEEESVMVAELRCMEPGCPLVETSISLLGGSKSRQDKVHRPVADVTREDIARLVENDSKESINDSGGGL